MNKYKVPLCKIKNHKSKIWLQAKNNINETIVLLNSNKKECQYQPERCFAKLEETL